MMDLNKMVIFARVVEAGSFIGAARHLAIPKSTISRRVAELEEELGVRLLERSTRKLRLTEAGSIFFERCMRIATDVEEARASVTQHQLEPQGRLRVTASVLFGERFLSGVIPRYLKRYPKVELELFLAPRTVDLMAEGFDIAIRASELTSTSLIAKKMAPSPTYVCASPDYIDKHGAPETPDDLKQHQCIVYSPEFTQVTWQFERHDGHRVAVPIAGPLLVNSCPIALDAILQGLGIGRLPGFLCHDAIRDGRLRWLLCDWPKPTLWIHALYPSRRHLSATIRTFLDFVSTELNPPPWLLDQNTPS